MSTRMMSGPIWQISLKGITISGSQFRKFRILLPPGTMILQMQPLQGSNSRSHTFPNFLQFLVLMTSLHFNSENNTVFTFFLKPRFHNICLKEPRHTWNKWPYSRQETAVWPSIPWLHCNYEIVDLIHGRKRPYGHPYLWLQSNQGIKFTAG